jgi:phage I-like protein
MKTMGTGPIYLSDSDPPLFGYIVDLDGVTFNDDGTWIQAMPLGRWDHPVHGPIQVTLERVQRFAANVNAGVRGQDLDIDYDHKKLTTEAAGWIRQAEARSDGLWLFIDWTKSAADKIKEKAFRYFSPEFQDEWKHPASGMKFKDVLFGGALTNRPFLKGIQPINLAEYSSTGLPSNDNSNSGGNMNRELLELLAKLHGVEFDDKTSDDDLQTKVSEKVQASGGSATSGDTTTTTTTPPGEPDPTKPPEGTPDPSLTPAMAHELKRLAEDNSVVAALLADRDATKRRLEALEVASRMTDVKRKLNDAASDRLALSPVAHQRLSEIVAGMPKESGDKIIDVVKMIISEGGLVQLGESGYASAEGRNKDAGARMEAAVKKLMSENDKLEYGDAMTTVAAMDPELFDAYRSMTYTDRA